MKIENCRFVRMLSRQSDCPLSFHGWLLFSFLNSYKKPIPFSAKKIIANHLMSKEAAYNARDELIELQLLDSITKLPLQPPENYFYPRKGNKLAYWLYYLPSEKCPCGKIEFMVYCYCRSINKAVGKKALHTALGISEHTADKKLKELRNMGLVKGKKVEEDIPFEWLLEKYKIVLAKNLPPQQRAERTIAKMLDRHDTSSWRDFIDVFDTSAWQWQPEADWDQWQARAELLDMVTLAYKIGLRKSTIDDFIAYAIKLTDRHKKWKVLQVCAYKVKIWLEAANSEIGDNYENKRFEKLKHLFTVFNRYYFQWQKKRREPYDIFEWHDCGVYR